MKSTETLLARCEREMQQLSQLAAVLMVAAASGQTVESLAAGFTLADQRRRAVLERITAIRSRKL